METKIIKQKQDLTYLKWSHIRSASGTAGTFLKSESNIAGVKKYYKLSNFDSEAGVIGHECINEITEMFWILLRVVMSWSVPDKIWHIWLKKNI